MKGKAGKKILIAVIAVLVVGGLLFYGYRKKAGADTPGGTKAAAKTAQGETPTVFAVNTTKAVLGQINDYIELNGDVETKSSVDIYADTSGKLVRLPISVGDRITKDQVIAEVDPSRPGSNFVASPVKSPITGIHHQHPRVRGEYRDPGDADRPSHDYRPARDPHRGGRTVHLQDEG